MNDKDFVIEVAKRIIPVVSISPESGGDGESKRADELIKILKDLGYENVERYDVKDKMGYVRSNLILKIGNAEKTLWLVSHIDTVPVGDRSLWKHDPFSVTVEGDRMYGRGTEDDGQAVFTSLLILKHLKPEKLKYNLGLAFVADEEMGSVYGIQYVLTKNIFRDDDLIIVPDAGTEDGLMIETAEKSILWIKFIVTGKQSHASTPDEGINTLRESSRFITMIDEKLHSKYTASNKLFRPAKSTFEPTKHEKNVDNVNTIPGLEIFYLDSRVLPEYKLDNVIKDIDDAINSFEANSRATI
ncbi:MAG: M20 family metallo-hydrolase, partial [Thermoplasmata archaeon]